MPMFFDLVHMAAIQKFREPFQRWLEYPDVVMV